MIMPPEVGHEELFKLHCEPRFNSMEQKLDKICNLLQGEGMSTGLVDDVRELQQFKKRSWAALCVVAAAVLTSLITWLKERLF